MGQVTATHYPDGTTERMAYDAHGQLQYFWDRAGNRTAFAYDLAGDLVSVTDAVGQTTRYQYDSSGNRTESPMPMAIKRPSHTMH